MKIYKNNALASDLKDSYIFFDTSALIALLNFDTIYKEILVELKNLVCLFKFRKAFLFTENHSHFSTNLLDRTQILTIDQGNEQIRNIAFYKFSEEKYQKILEKLKVQE